MAISSLHHELPVSAKATDESKLWFERAKRVMAGGVASSARSAGPSGPPCPLYLVRGAGARVWDADGNEYVDYLFSNGSVVLGHADPGLSRAAARQLEFGTMFGTCNTIEVELAEQVCRMVPCAELVRFANSGSEAVAAAIRLARGFTGRNKVLKFEGHYHGWQDVLAISNRPGLAECGPFEAPASVAHSGGIPECVVQDVVVAPWNEPEILRALLDRHARDLACIIAEPIVANNACIMPEPDFLELLREECTRRGLLLIFDEIVTGFRVAPGGAQELFGVVPDLAVYSKAAAGGFPLSLIAGRREVMELLGTGKVRHGGTYNSNPLCAAAALHTLRRLAEPETRRRIDLAGRRTIEALRRSAAETRVPCVVMGTESMFQVVFGDLPFPPRQYRDLLGADVKRFAVFRQSLLEDGVHINASGLACWFPSAAHDAADLALAESAIARAFRTIAAQRSIP